MKIKFYILCFVICLVESLTAQVDTLYICNPGDPIQLNAPPGLFSYQWSPDLLLDNPTIANPMANPFENTTFVARIISRIVGDNLISNPDFSEGNTGFISEYDFVDRISTQGVYGVNESAENLNPIFFEDCPDHTDGQGLMMVVDGSPIPNELVWCQTITVEPFTDYAFSSWLSSVNPSNPAALQFSINGERIGAVFRASSRVCEWRQFYEIWNSGDSEEATICIVNQNTNPEGNDFVLDDFAFYELEEILYDTTVVLIEALEAAKERRSYFPNAFSPNKDGINDLFRPYFGKGVQQLKDFKIFNRWGQLVFSAQNCEPNDENCGWDGSFRGEPLDPGVYIYYAQILFADQNLELVQGDLSLLR